MRVVLHDEIFAPGASATTDLAHLFGFGWRGRHAIETNPVSLVEPGIPIVCPPIFDSWLKQQSLELRRECEEALAMGSKVLVQQMPERCIHVTLTNEPNWETAEPELPLKIAVRVLSAPLAVKVENAKNDRNFVLATAPPEWRKQLEEHEEEQWLRFDHGGGADLQAQISQLAGSREKCWRTLVIVDSDALRRGVPSADAKTLEKKCVQLDIPIHILQRRAIENYLPLPLLRSWQHLDGRPAEKYHRSRLVEALAKLEEEQRHHYYVKRGFKGEEKRDDLKNQGDLFRNLPRESEEILARGFGDKIADLFDRTQFRHHDDWFLDDDTQNEIAPFLTRLLRYI